MSTYQCQDGRRSGILRDGPTARRAEIVPGRVWRHESLKQV